MSLADDRITEAAAALDYESYVLQPDGSFLTQSTAREIIVHMSRMLELQPGLRVLEIGTGSGYTSALLGRIVGDQGSVVSLDATHASPSVPGSNTRGAASAMWQCIPLTGI